MGVTTGMILALLGVLLLIACLALAAMLRLQRTRQRSTLLLHTGDSEVRVVLNEFGVPAIKAASREDAYWALGYLIARDRLFQIDLLRRMVSGHLAEIFGSFAVKSDIKQRTLGFQRVAGAVLTRLPADQLQVLQAYTDGVNAYRNKHPRRPFECLLLRYTPGPWTLEDCILIGLYIFQDLTSVAERYKRSASIMRQTLPKDVLDFFTSDEDAYPQVLLGGMRGRRPLPPLPIDSLKALLQHTNEVPAQPFSDEIQQVKGSNGWVIGPTRTRDGRAILANDMHLSLTMPGIWYKAELHYDDVTLSGMVVPGLPGVMLGSNSFVSWGFTNTSGDFLDLIEIEQHPEQDEMYNTPDGWHPFTMTKEQIEVRGKQPVEVTIRSTIWGPVSSQPLLGKPVALRWTALDPDAMNCAILNMDRVHTVDDAIKVMHDFGAPPMNAMLVDAEGHIGWTICGKIPLRRANDGFASTPWTDQADGWEGYVPPEEMPCIVDPPAGFLATANNRTTGARHPYVIGYNYASGYRARRISEQLRDIHEATEESMFALQLDSTCTFYEFYQQLALTLLTPETLASRPHLREVRDELEAWDGRAEIDSRGIVLLTAFRELLAERVLEAYFALCLQADEQFIYGWNSMELPLRLLLTEREPEIFPCKESYPDWEALIIATLEECTQKVRQKSRRKALNQITWGQQHRSRIRHPLGYAIPLLGKLLNMPARPLAGTPFSIRASAPGYGVTIRLVISPSHEQDGLYNIPGGQSGRVFSRHYRDQYSNWLKGQGTPFYQEEVSNSQ